MEWLEITARSVDEAKELLLDQLGVDADEADFEVVEEPKPGLFGRTRGEARVRGRVKPAQVRQKVDRRRRDRREKTDGNGDTAACHHPAYNFDDSAIPFGASWYAGMAEARMPST